MGAGQLGPDVALDALYPFPALNHGIRTPDDCWKSTLTHFLKIVRGVGEEHERRTALKRDDKGLMPRGVTWCGYDLYSAVAEEIMVAFKQLPI